jgi:hypothetical protein
MFLGYPESAERASASLFLVELTLASCRSMSSWFTLVALIKGCSGLTNTLGSLSCIACNQWLASVRIFLEKMQLISQDYLGVGLSIDSSVDHVEGGGDGREDDVALHVGAYRLELAGQCEGLVVFVGVRRSQPGQALLPEELARLLGRGRLQIGTGGLGIRRVVVRLRLMTC